MPGSHFHPVLNGVDNGRELLTTGPFPVDDDLESMRVVGVVTQAPKEVPSPGVSPRAAICHGSFELTSTQAKELRMANKTEGVWSFQAKAVQDVAFEMGWARGTALALVIKTNGDMETYSWSEWVWVFVSP